jgi:hypothetical protein
MGDLQGITLDGIKKNIYILLQLLKNNQKTILI